MPSVIFMPLDLRVEAEEGDTILEVALKNGVKLEHNCGGSCACTTCHVIIRGGEASLSEIEDEEDDQLGEAEGLTMHSRLGCQALVLGDEDVVVEIPSHVGHIMGVN